MSSLRVVAVCVFGMGVLYSSGFNPFGETAVVEPAKTFQQDLAEVCEGLPRSVSPGTQLQEINLVNDQRLEMRYVMDDDAVVAFKNSNGQKARDCVESFVDSDPLNELATTEGIEVEHIFVDQSGSLLLAMKSSGGHDGLNLPAQVTTQKTLETPTGLQANPFIK
ncbi:hypothetical protein K227x_10870 [Rubripirellula lacrimiformis]|uniref:Uncharacterized protein n=1 Tax=Rubripirellula lacrimiformis TaxID=1930273 RepID=A0A517N6E4_9BACT|nr:hypothetical protein [Rubripirellula lacrimiformis]QDT02709.1 hypothetical protein K227x_10870 [Rubripirellula lacrimiformis]